MKISRTLANQIEYWLLWLGVSGICWPVCLVFAVLIGQGFALLIPPTIALVCGIIAGGMILGSVQLVLMQPPLKGDRRVLTGDLTAILVAWALGWCILSIVALVTMVTLLPRPEKRGTDVHIRWWL